ncbi:MAG: alpha/beta fold hydrolase [Acidobacteriota bacterium]
MRDLLLHARRHEGAGEPLVILHGLYGSSRSWSGVGRRLAEHFDVWTLDLRNHGQSPHDGDCSWSAMASDVRRTVEELGLERPALLGHSLGGKVAMHLVGQSPDFTRRLFVADIAPREYRPDAELLEALLRLDLDRVERRSDADRALEQSIPDPILRGFLLTNLTRSGEGYAWQCNLEGLHASLDEIGSAPLEVGTSWDGPTRFIVGGASEYWQRGDEQTVRSFFPAADVVVLQGAGHNVHVEGGEAFLEALLSV